MFKETCFGYFLHLPLVHIQNQLIHHLMLREIVSVDSNVFRIMMNGTQLHFGIKEFAAITGLNCLGDDTLVDDPAPNRLMSTYFPNLSKVPRIELLQCIFEKRWTCDEDAVKISALFFIHYFVLSTDNGPKSYIPKAHFDLIESGRYLTYPLGKASFSALLETISKKLHPKGKFYRIGGLPLALQVWFYECCLRVDGSIACCVGQGIPRILN